MASIVRRAAVRGSRYDVRYRTPSGDVRTRTFNTLADARKFKATTEADLVRGDWIDPAGGRASFASWWDTWWRTTVDLRPSTRARDESYARTHLLPSFGAMTLASIDHTTVTEWVAALSAAGLAPATVKQAKLILSKCLAAAVDAGKLKANSAARVKTPRIEVREMRFLTPDEVATLAERIDPRYRALVYVGAYCGLRIGELGALTRERVDLLHRRVEVLETVTEVRGHHYLGPPKTKAGRRTVPVPRSIVAILTAHLDSTPGALVFPSPEGHYLRASLFRHRIWRPAVTATGLDGLRPHDLRHTAASFWIAAGASPKAIATRAGHASVATVLDRYGHLLPGHEEAVDDALDAMAEAARAGRSALTSPRGGAAQGR